MPHCTTTPLKYLIIFFLLVYAVLNPAHANPVLDHIASGDVQIQQIESTLTVQQTSDKAILNWQSFNIPENEKVHFQQPANGVVLNRINPSEGVSKIFGTLTATGRLILVNPAGVHFGPNAHVNVAGIVVSAGSGITDQNFLRGDYRFDQASTYQGAIINEGSVKAADYGLVAFVGNTVINRGIIEARLGRVILASGEKFVIGLNSGDLNTVISFVIQTPSIKKLPGVKNTGAIYADGGRIVIEAKTVASILDNVINIAGMPIANSVEKHAGIIHIKETSIAEIAIKRQPSELTKKIYTAGSKTSRIDVHATPHPIQISESSEDDNN